MMKHLYKLLAILFLLFIGVSCSKSDEPAPEPTPATTTFKANFQNIPNYLLVQGQGGNAIAILNQTEKTMQVTVNCHSEIPFIVNSCVITKLSNLQIPNQEIVLNLTDKAPNSLSAQTSFTKTFTLTDEQMTTILNNKLNISTYLSYSSTTYSAQYGELLKTN